MKTIEYKGNAAKGGIYALRNKVNGKLYIGCTNKFKQRKSSHAGYLNRNSHQNTYLQASHNKYGQDTFEFLILEIIDDSETLFRKEYEYIIKYRTLERDFGYNLLINNTPGSYNRHTQETKDKISISRKGKLKGIIPSNLNANRELIKRPIIQYTDGVMTNEYESCKFAGSLLGIDYKTINNNCRGVTKTIRGLPGIIFKYKDGKPARHHK